MKELSWYIAGPMSNIPQFNFPAFMEAAKTLRQKGYKVINPAELDNLVDFAAAMASPDGAELVYADGSINSKTWGDFLSRDVKLIADECGAMVLLDGWGDSSGARLEAMVAITCDMPLFTYNKSAIYAIPHNTVLTVLSSKLRNFIFTRSLMKEAA